MMSKRHGRWQRFKPQRDLSRSCRVFGKQTALLLHAFSLKALPYGSTCARHLSRERQDPIGIIVSFFVIVIFRVIIFISFFLVFLLLSGLLVSFGRCFRKHIRLFWHCLYCYVHFCPYSPNRVLPSKGPSLESVNRSSYPWFFGSMAISLLHICASTWQHFKVRHFNMLLRPLPGRRIQSTSKVRHSLLHAFSL